MTMATATIPPLPTTTTPYTVVHVVLHVLCERSFHVYIMCDGVHSKPCTHAWCCVDNREWGAMSRLQRWSAMYCYTHRIDYTVIS